MRTRRMIVFIAVASLVALVAHSRVLAQEATSLQRDEYIPINGRATVYLTYERAEPLKQVTKGEGPWIWLRLHNDTSCPIFIFLTEGYLTRPVDGVFSFDLKEGSVVQMAYRVKVSSRARRKATRTERRTPSAGSRTYVTRLPSHTSVTFSVPLEELNEGSKITVLYAYKEDQIHGKGAIGAYFDFMQLPPQIRQNKR